MCISDQISYLEGLLSLTVEFFRTAPSRCTHDNAGNSISSSHFPYGGNVTCGLTCSIEQGPHSPLRGGSANNIYVIPAPDKITFGAATLFAAACCIPAILSLISMWNKILEINWRTHYGYGDGDEEGGEQIEGTMTTEEHRETANEIRKYLRKVEAPLFGGAVLTILIMGERNFFSTQVSYQTEPMASIGKPFTLVHGIRISDRVDAVFRSMGAHCWYWICRHRVTMPSVSRRY